MIAVALHLCSAARDNENAHLLNKLIIKLCLNTYVVLTFVATLYHLQ